MDFSDGSNSLLKASLKPLSYIKLQFSDNYKFWLKVGLVAGSSIGAVYIGGKLVKYIIVSKRKQRELPVNGLKPISFGLKSERHSESPARIKDISVPDSSNVTLTFASLPRHRTGSLRARRRNDSFTSGSTTLLLSSRSPSELTLYGLETIKRAVKLFEECKSRVQGEDERASVDSELEFIISKARQLVDDIEDFRKGITPERDIEEEEYSVRGYADDTRSIASSFDGTITSSITLPYFDIEPNIHFFKLYTQALENIDSIPLPRVIRTDQLNCDSDDDFIAKVQCLREAFSFIFIKEENRQFFIDIGKDILTILLTHSLQDPSDCLAAYYEFLEFVTNTENHSELETEVATRSISCISFYDLVLDYVILDSFDDLENPPSAVLSVANNRWLSAGFRELALQTAVTAVLRHKRSKLVNSCGFFAHFYNILEHISPILAWGFLGTDYELKFKCNLIKESISDLIRDYFTFDKVRYTSLQDLSHDILKLTDEEYCELQRKLSV
ncbi:protein FAM73B-like protein [Leptotrombidium deliense]|uniref:Protein FAM73B-like protein n=1 Tax=Leptotrombidium deliense TaxID=299467 RepID=A0A443SEA5_9ACAR|nr:protein FAM73B-like protein [Leptotrombidium deliense]